MKTKILLILAVITVKATMAGITEIPKMNISHIGEEEALVAFNSSSPTNFELTVTDENNSVVFFHKSNKKHATYSEKIDFSKLGDGVYCICMNYGNQSLNNKIFVSNKKIHTDDVVRLYEPYIKIEKNTLNFSFLNTAQKQVYLNIYKEGEHLNGYKLGKNLAIQKRFDISNLKNGTYQVVVTDDFKDHFFTLIK